MRTVPPSPRQVYFSAALTAAAVAVAVPGARLPSPAPSPVTAEMAVLRPARAAGHLVLPAPQAFASYRAAHRPVASPPPSPSATAPRVSEDLESAAVVPPPAPAPSTAAPVAPQPSYAPPPSPYPSYTPVPSQSAAYASSGSGSESSFQECVIAAESGGNAQVMNASGHYGLYQFDLGTWISGGGNPADFGHASVAEQNAVFASVYAARGTSPWGPYDGC
jgi:hypothetical protein